MNLQSLAGTPGARTSYAAYALAEKVPFGIGKQAFSFALRFAAPYFISIPATVVSAEPGRAEVKMHDRPWVRNHLGTVHAIALCNLAELVMGLAAEATVPTSHRWIPKEMDVKYQAKARGTLLGTATLDLPDPPPDGAELPVSIAVTDEHGTEVFAAEIRLWVTAA